LIVVIARREIRLCL